MPPDTVVEHLDIIEHNLPCLITGFKFEVMQAFRFKRAEETFHGPTDNFASVQILEGSQIEPSFVSWDGVALG